MKLFLNSSKRCFILLDKLKYFIYLIFTLFISSCENNHPQDTIVDSKTQPLDTNAEAIKNLSIKIERFNKKEDYFKRGVKLFHMGKYLEAEDDFVQAARIGKIDNDYLYYMGWCGFYLGNYKDVENIANAGLKMDNKNVEMYELKGLGLLFSHDTTNACVNFNTAVKFGDKRCIQYINKFCK